MIFQTHPFLLFTLRKYLELIKFKIIRNKLVPTVFSMTIFNKCALNVQIFLNVERVINVLAIYFVRENILGIITKFKFLGIKIWRK